MFCKAILPCESFTALIALKRLLPCVRPHVALQFIYHNTIVVALVTLVWLFPCMLPHHMIFQMASCNARILAHCASVRLFALLTFLLFLPSVSEQVSLQSISSPKWFVALGTLVLFVPVVGFPVIGKASCASKCLLTQVARPLVSHVKLRTPLQEVLMGTDGRFWEEEKYNPICHFSFLSWA